MHRVFTPLPRFAIIVHASSNVKYSDSKVHAYNQFHSGAPCNTFQESTSMSHFIRCVPISFIVLTLSSFVICEHYEDPELKDFGVHISSGNGSQL